MATNSATVVAASLDSSQLEASINSLVNMVAQKTKAMADNFTSEVKRMENAVKNLGNIKIDSGGAADGGSAKRAAGFERLQKSVNDASASLQKHQNELVTLKNVLGSAQEQENSFLQAKQNAANTIAQENELLNKQQSELSGLRTQQAGVTQEVEKYAQASRNASSLRTKYEKSVSLADQLEKEYEKLKSMPDQSELLKKYNKDVEKFAADLKANLEKVRSARRESIGFGTTDNWLSIGSIDTIARHGIDKYTKDYINRLKEIARKELYSQAGNFDFKAGRTDGLKEIRQYIQDIKSTRERLQGILKSKDFEFYKPDGLKAAIQYYKDIEKEYTAIEKRLSGLHGKYQTAMSAPDNSVKIADAQIKLSQAYNDVVVNAKAVTKAEGEVFAAREKSAQASQQKAQIDAQVAAKEKEIAETKGRIATATKEQSEAEKNASQASQVRANVESKIVAQEKIISDTRQQLTSATKALADAEKQTADGGSSRRTSKQKEEETQVKATTQAYKEQSVSLDQLASAQQKAIRLPSEMRMPDVAKSARESFQAFYKGFNEQARQIEPLIQSWEKLLQARHTGNIEQVAQKIAQVKHEIAELVKEQANLSKTKPQGYLDEIAKRNPQIKALREQLTSLETEHQKLKASDPFKDNPYLNTLREKLQGVKSAMNDADTTSRRLLFTTKELTEEQKKLAEASLQKSLSHAMKIPTNEIDLARVKLESLQGLLIQMGERGLLSNSQKFKINEEIQRLVNFIADADSKQSSLISGSKRYTEEIRKQAEAIKSIDNQNKAKSVFTSVTQMDANNIEQLRFKLNNLLELKNKVAGTPLLSKSNLNMLDWMIGDVKRKISEIGTAQNQASNQQKKTLDDMNAYIRQNIQREQERREAIRQTGLAAQDAFAKIRQNAQIQLAENTDKPIKGIKELTDAITNMRRLYFDMSTAERESPLGLALKRDIENAQKLKIAIDAYNRTLKGMSVLSTNSNANSSLGAYTELTNILKTLSDEYKRLGREERNAAKGNDLADKIQRLSRETQKIQQQMSRPISFEAAMKGSEKTLDDIAYKMQRLGAYKQGIDLTKPNAANEIRQVDEALVRLQKDMNKYLSKSKDVLNSNNALGRSWNYMKNRLAFYFTVGASTQFIKNLIEVRSQYEMNERALGILINSAERGTQIFNELSQMALVSPYTLIELSAAAKQLTAYDIAARDVVDTTRRLADMASAVGVPIERLTYALGQIKAYGYLNSRDARMFANAGIPLVKQLSDYYTELEGKMVSTADVYDRMKKKAIDYNSVMSVIYKMTDEGGKFFDFQAKMADTLKVRLANLTLAWNNMLNEMGKETQGVLTWSIGALRDLFLQWKNLYGALNEVAFVLGVAKALQFLGVCAHAAGIGFGSLNKYMTLNALLGTKLATTVRTLGNAFMSLVHSPLAWFTMAALLVTEIGDAFINADRATKEFNKSLREGAKTTYEDLKKFAEQYKNVRDSLYKTETFKGNKDNTVTTTLPQNIEEGEAKKVWEVMREQIELSSHASDEYISKLLSIENVSERLRQGFQILDDIQTVSAALKEIGEDGIKVTQGWAAWWNAWQGADGLIGNVKDLQKEIQRLRDTGQDPNDKFTKVIDKDYATALERFRKDLKVTTDSVIDFINLNGWSGDTGKIDEVFKQVTDRLATQSNLDPQTAFTLQREVEVARAKAAKEALEIRIADEKNALATASDEISKQQIQKNLETLEQQKRDFDKFNGENRAYWNDFTKYIKERHISELTAAYNSMTDHGKKAMDFQSEEWQKHVHDWANRYEKSHNLATDSVFNRLRNWINDANTWSVFIKMTISTEDGKSVYKQLEEYDKAADDAWKTMQRLDKRISQLRKKGAKEVKGDETDVIDLSRVSQDDKELTEALKERTQAQKDYNDAVEKGGESKKENTAASKAQKAAESELQKALKDELQLIDRVRSQYKKLVDAGANSGDALTKVTNQFGNSIARINSILGKNNLPLFDISKFAGTDNPHALLDMLKLQLDSAKIAKNIKPEEIKELEVKYSEVDVDADAYDLTKITKGLNNELDRLKDEYELAVSLDADPELGNAFAGMMGIDMESLPHTVKEYADEYSKYLNKYLKGKNSSLQFTGDELRGLTRDDITAFRERVDAGSFNQEWFDAILKAYEDISGKRKKDLEETEKWKNSLIEKYGNLQDKLTKIYKDSVQNQVNAVKTFGTEDQKSDIVRLQLRLEATDNPAELTEINTEIAKIVKDVTDKNPIALKLVTASDNQTKADESKAYWEDFKNSELYAMTFEDMANNSTRAIQLIMDKLEGLKDKVKEDPASMKALIKSLEDAQKELNARDPFGGVARSLRDMAAASRETKAAQEALWRAEVDVEQAQQAYDNAEDGTPEEREAAQKALASAIQKRTDAQNNLTKAENKGKKAQENLKSSLQGITGQLGNVKSLFDTVSSLFRAGGDDETADAIDAISEGFSIMTTVIMGVVAAMILLESSQPWLLAIAAALSVIVGLVSFLSGNENKKIDAKIKNSELAVKRLELAYIDLQQAVDRAYGTATIGAKQATLANKELQLAEIQRQIELEKSRKSKNRDEDRIIELEKQYKELFYEIKNGYTEIVDDLMGTDVGSFAENLVSSMIDAFKQGEDYMQVFSDKFDEMIDNMIMKSIVSRVVSQYLDAIWEDVDKHINDRTEKEREDAAKAQNEAVRRASLSDDEVRMELVKQRGDIWSMSKITQKDIDDYRKAALAEEKSMQARLDAASAFTGSDVDYVMQRVTEVMPELGQKLKDILGEYYKFGESSETQLSALQQGISQISEQTAGALEAYANSISQQAYLRNDLLVQIRDTIMSFDMDVQLGVFSQMLLQLQNNYIVMQSMQSIMEGWTTPSGQGIRVELIS